VGTGKTTLINRLVQDIQGKAYTAKIPDPGLSKYDFYRMVSRYFGLPIEVRTKSDFLAPFSRFLNDAHEEKKSVLLLIDEAQRLKHDLMEEIRLLSNLERQDVKLLNIFFVGQNEFNSILLQPENRALLRRITITYNIEPLDQVETCAYIRHRLKTAGAGYEIFSSAAMDAVFDFSRGYPRQINIICDLAMFFSSQVSRRTISRKIVDQCRERISFSVDELPVETKNNLRVPAPQTHYRPTQKTRRPWFSAARVLGTAVVLMVIGSGVYVTPDPLKARARQWVRETYQTYFTLSDEPSGRKQPAVKASQSTNADDARAAPNASPQAASTHVSDQRLLPMPSRPPELSFAKTADDHPRAVSAVTTPVPERPDPADAIDWLLKKRKLKKSADQ